MSDVHEFGVPVEDELATTEARPGNILDEVRAALSKPVDAEPVTFPVPLRPNFKVQFNCDIDYDLLQMWSRKATTKDKFQQLKFSMMILASKCEAIIYKGETLTDDEGTAFTFAHNQFQREFLNVTGTQEAIAKFYGKDGHVISVAGSVLEKAGYDDIDLEADEDPFSGN